MKTRFIVTYDIGSDERRTAVFRLLKGYGRHLQFSVFECDLTDRARATLISRLHPLIDLDEDQILMINLGPTEGRAATCIEALGRRYLAPERTVVVI